MMSRNTRRGVALKTVQLDGEVADALRRHAAITGRPMRWHVERALAAALDVDPEVYRLNRYPRIAAGIVTANDLRKVHLAGLVAEMQTRCVKLGIAPPHAQTARKHLRAAAVAQQCANSALMPRSARAFSAQEDRELIAARAAGKSLSQIGMQLNRRSNVVLRRLRYLTGTQEL
jgi:predicted transcriptional regulator